MKRMALALLLALSLTACGSPQKEAVVPMTAPAEQPAISVQPPFEEAAQAPPGPSTQDRAIAAYGEILAAVTVPGATPYTRYSGEFGDAYLEDNYLVVCLTDSSEAMQEQYRSYVSDPDILRFREVQYGYSDLMALQYAIVEVEGVVFSSLGVNVEENRVDMGTPEIAREEEMRQLLSESLPAEIVEPFETLPLYMYEEGYATFG